uniref:Uncharacterized protein n=1 Tax=Skeletonema marinoi TaxID=267567 RepID=A0A7S2M1S1_9STRA|mmetsp:Transcript_33875/g.57205  ORF Transcript_33875/g.57205 Transcript_33875/m.57205 type:complete len:236 (+) Transcript_33875:129-836(+)
MLVDSTVGDIQQKIHRRASGTESIENVGTLRKSLVTPRPLVPPQGRISDKRKDPRYHRKTKSKKNGDSGNSSDTEQTNSLGMTCQKNIKLKTGESRVCIGEKEAICNDDDWSFGVLNGEAKLFNPENKAVWTMCASVTQICILEDETNPKSTHLMFYNDQEVSGELECKGTGGDMFTTTLHRKRQKMGKNTGRKKGPILKLSKGAGGNFHFDHDVPFANASRIQLISTLLLNKIH